jgi:hypothetical protein
LEQLPDLQHYQYCYMKLNCVLTTIVLFKLSVFTAFSQTDHVGASFSPPAHPRILMFKGEEQAIKKTISGDRIWEKMQTAIFSESGNIVSLPVLERIKIGRRLLSVSREALRRIFFLSYTYRMTGDRKYLQRAEKEMLAIAAFSDWNPTHFLDVAEMTMAMAIGYDWLNAELNAESKSVIKEAIIKKGLEPSLEKAYSSWVKVEHNWNQVCHAGMTYGAMAIYEDNPQLAKQIINRALDNIVFAMKDYAPDGIYPEGYGYWGYGTSFNVMFNSAIEKLFGKDFGLNEQPGFLKTGYFLENMTGPSGSSFNYSDVGTGGSLQPAMFWFAVKQKDPSLLWVERSRLINEDPKSHVRNRLLPAMMLWNGGVKIENVTAPKNTMFKGAGKNPVALMRTSWTDPQAVYVAMKGGSVSVNHAHMDIGSFVMEADGVRWAMDFGSQDYESLESKGIQLFGRSQDAQRWTVFRLTNFVHNTLTINNQHQRVTGNAALNSVSDKPDFMNAVTDMSEVYKGAAAKVVRGIALVDKSYVVVRDEIEARDTVTTIRWTLLTPAEVKITGKNTAELSKDGKKLFLEVRTPAQVTMKTWSTDPPNSYDAPNPGTIMVGFEATIPAGTKTVLDVSLVPSKAVSKKIKKPMPLESWPKN